ncbi:HEAT repeat domain-containing protein [Candidatus Micrarchaeota archaeon]|nr:HEAT repeat domain-containing protein [Candidatus Micrarchaeota archaeon]
MQRELKHSGNPEGISKKEKLSRRVWKHLMDTDKSETINAFRWIKANVDLWRGNWSSGHPGGLGSTSGWGVKVLEKALIRGDEETRLKAATAMGLADYHRPSRTAPALLSAMEGDPSEGVRLEAATSLGLIAYQAIHMEYEWGWELLMPRLENLLGDSLLSRSALRIIGSVLEYQPYADCDSLVKKVLGIIIAESNDNYIEAITREILERLGVHGIPSLVKAIGNANEKAGEEVAYALCKIAKKHPEEVASEIIDYVNGRGGDILLEINAQNDFAASALNEVLKECGEAMENAA